jgi:hypothetical protein
VPLYPAVPLVFLATYAALFMGAVLQQPVVSVVAVASLIATYALYSLTA